MEHYQKALEQAEKRGDERQIGEACFALGRAHTEQDNDILKAISYYERALEIANKRKDEEQMINAYLELAVSYKLSNQFDTAIDYYKKILEITKDKEDNQLKTKVCIGLGDAFQLRNRIQEAIATFSEALNIAKKQEDSLHETEAYLWLGNVYRIKNEFQPAIHSYEEALKIAKTRHDGRQQTEAYFGLGHAHKTKTENVQLAIDNYRKALEISIEQKDKRLETEAYFGLADGYRLNDSTKEARENYQRALEMAKERGDMRQMTDAHLWLGHIYKSENELQPAIREYEMALELARKQGDERQETEALLGLGDAKKFENEEANGNISVLDSGISREDGVQREQIPQISGKSVRHREKMLLLKDMDSNELSETEIPLKAFVRDEKLKIGKGSDGTRVFVGLMEDGQEVAVKIMLKDSCEASARNESKIFNRIKNIRSPYLVNYWNFHISETDMYLVIGLCEESLDDLISSCSAEYLQKHGTRMIREILLGLKVLHDEGILHRDLKPSNILVNVEGRMQLADFGNSRVLNKDKSAVLTSPKGTPGWMPPEVIKEIDDEGSKGRYKKKSDVHVAGMIAFFILTKGEHLFGPQYDRMSNIMRGNPVFLDKIEEPTAKQFISLLTSHEINERPSVAEALEHSFLKA